MKKKLKEWHVETRAASGVKHAVSRGDSGDWLRSPPAFPDQSRVGLLQCIKYT